MKDVEKERFLLNTPISERERERERQRERDQYRFLKHGSKTHC